MITHRRNERNAAKQVFISYGSNDARTARLWRDELRHRGFKVWIAPESIPVGSNYMESIPNAIRKSAAFLLLLSEDSQYRAKWVRKELSTAITYGIPVFPVFIEDCGLQTDFAFSLNDVQILEYKSDMNDAIDEIAKLLNDVCGHISTGDRYSIDKYGGYDDMVSPSLPPTPLFVYEDIREPIYAVHVVPTPENVPYDAKIAYIGVGGSGNTVVDGLNVPPEDIYAVNSDKAKLDTLKTANKVQIGEEITRGYGAGSDPERGKAAAKSSYEKLKRIIEHYDVVIIFAGLGGGIGSGASSVIAEIARSLDKLTVAIVSKPFLFEGEMRKINADTALKELSGTVNSFAVFECEQMSRFEKATPQQAFDYFSEQMRECVEIVSIAVASDSRKFVEKYDCDTKPDIRRLYGGVENGDLPFYPYEKAIKPVAGNSSTGENKTSAAGCPIVLCEGQMLVGKGIADGENRGIEALKKAVHYMPCGDVSIEGARNLFVKISGNINDVEQATSLLKDICDRNVQMRVITETADSADACEIMYIASGLPL